jgi:hypothetical protein
MHDFIRKLWNSKTTIAVILWIAVFVWVYNLNPAKKSIIPHTPAGKTVEEIMATPVDTVQEASWDKDFKSAVEPM